MARYFFDLHECGVVCPDDEGVILPGAECATAYAAESARQIIAAQVTEGSLSFDCHIDIRDEGGSVIQRVTFMDAIQVKGLPN